MTGKTILVLDENEASRAFIANELGERQFEILEASSAREALIFAWRDQPDAILFDPVVSDLPVEEFIRKLRRDARTGNTPLIALSSDLGPALRETCIHAGVTEYLIKSSEAVAALEEIFKRIFDAAPQIVVEERKADLEAKMNEKEAGLLIVFLSAKGGTGTSSLCANLAMNIKAREPEMSVVVADLVLPIGSIAQIVGADEKLNLVTAAELPSAQTNGEYFHKSLPNPELWQFQLLAGSPDPQHGNNLKGDRIGEIVDTLRAAYDCVILDIGRSLSRISLPLIQKADLIVLIMSTDQSTIHLTKTVLEYLQAQGIKDQSIYAILNRAVGLEGLTKTEAEKIINLPIKIMMPYMGSNFTLANNLNQPITKKYPTDTAAIVLKDAAENMLQLARRLRASHIS